MFRSYGIVTAAAERIRAHVMLCGTMARVHGQMQHLLEADRLAKPPATSNALFTVEIVHL